MLSSTILVLYYFDSDTTDCPILQDLDRYRMEMTIGNLKRT